MRLIAPIVAGLAYNLLVAAHPNLAAKSAGIGFSAELIKRHVPAMIEDRSNIAKRATASTGITSLNSAGTKWTIDMVVGGQTLPVVLDTGSHDLWFESNQQPATKTGSNHPLYTPPATTPIPGYKWAATFDSPKVVAAGVAHYDTVVIGAATVTNQVLGAATDVADINNSRKSGIIGLSHSSKQYNYGSSAPSRPLSYMENLKTQQGITKFAIDLHYGSGSRIDFGFIDSTRYTGSITYVNRNPSLVNWVFNLDNVYYVKDQQYSGTVANNGLTHVDTGAPNMNFPLAVVLSYYNQLPSWSKSSNGEYQLPCSDIDQLPSFGVSINGVKFTVPGIWMWSYQQSKTGEDKGNCVGALQPSKDGGSSVLGDMFLRNVFAVFDMNGPTADGQIGFATKPLPSSRPKPT